MDDCHYLLHYSCNKNLYCLPIFIVYQCEYALLLSFANWSFLVFIANQLIPVECMSILQQNSCRCGHDRMVVGFTTTYVISAYGH